MSQTQTIIKNSMIIGLLVSFTILTSFLPFLSLIIAPFLFHYIKETQLKENVSVVLIYITIELFLSISSFPLFLLTVFESVVLLAFCILINGLKPLIKHLTPFIFAYYLITMNSLALIGILTLAFTTPIVTTLQTMVPLPFKLILLLFITFQLFITHSISKRINDAMNRIFKPQIQSKDYHSSLTLSLLLKNT